MIALEPEALAERLGVRMSDGRPARAWIAQQLRTCIAHWGPSLRARLTRYLHQQLDALGADPAKSREALQQVFADLLLVGDFVSIRASGRTLVAPSLPAAVLLPDGSTAWLGARAQAVTEALDAADIVRREAPEGPEAAGQVAFADWCGPPGYTAVLARRGGTFEQPRLLDFWRCVADLAAAEGALVELDHVRALSGGPDQTFFGTVREASGRWQEGAPVGCWPAARRGRNEGEWHPGVVHVEAGGARFLDLFDWDEWTWVLLGRAAAEHAPERRSRVGDLVKFAHPIPRDHQRLLLVLGSRGAAWGEWRLSVAHEAAYDAARPSMT